MRSACCVGYIQTAKRQTNASKQADMSKFMFFFFCFFFLSLSVSSSFVQFVLPALSSSHVQTLCQTDVCSRKTRGVNKKRQRANKKTTERRSARSSRNHVCAGRYAHMSRGRTRRGTRETNNHMAVSNQVCSPNYTCIWRVVTHE